MTTILIIITTNKNNNINNNNNTERRFNNNIMANKSKKKIEEEKASERQRLEEQLTPNQITFCRLYVQGKMTNRECYMTAYKNSSPGAADVSATRLLKQDKIKRYINLLLDELGESVEISDKEIIRELKRIAFHSKNDNAKIKALTTLGTITGLLGKETRVTQNLITITVDDSINNATKRIEDNLNGQIIGTSFTIADDDDIDPDDPDNDDNDDAMC